ncbi:MAG TPA: HAMP domain-containing sensor histidine kinase [Solirubrobacteraceae bacterium]|jgi:signal transduction histidine kinase
MRRLGLRGRVTLATALVLAVGLALLTLGINLLLSHELDKDLSSVLRERADVQLAATTVTRGGLVVRDVPDDEALDEQAWVYQGARNVHRSSARPAVQLAAAKLAASPAAGGEVSVDDAVRLRAEPIFSDGHARRVGAVVVGASLVPYEHTENLALAATILLDCFLLAAGILLVRRAMGKALQPVAEMTLRAADWSEHDLDRRFDLGPPRDELTALSATLDRLLARIASSLRHEQRFSAEMAHELRTPLSGIRGEAELALRGQLDNDVRQALEQILRGTERMQTVIDTLLSAARGDTQGARGSAPAREAAVLAIDALRPLSERTGVQLRLAADSGELRVGADRDVIAQALQPLLENALRHAHATVSLGLSREQSKIIFDVQDDGAGPQALDPDSLFEPGASTVGSAGLGLALARRLARSCGGEVTVDLSARGGRFILRLPAVAY